MTEKIRNKLRKFLSKPRLTIEGERKLKPAVLTDSKGHIDRYATHNAERDILWWSESGENIEKRTTWLKKNIASKIIRHGDIWLYTWLGTCNLTSKNKKYIALTSESDTEIDNIIRKYEEIIEIVNKYPGSRVTILETPIYSIKAWNTKQGHKNPNIFEDQDAKLESQIHKLNGKVREINNRLGSHSPEFSSDISNTSIYHCGNNRKTKIKRNYEFGLYRDGIHPDELLAKNWLKKISEQTKRDCWDKVSKPSSK